MKIKSIQINLPMHSECYVVGEKVSSFASHSHVRFTDETKNKVVTEIKDMGIEYENEYHSFFEVFADGKLFKRIEYTPVSIEYEVN